MMILFEGRRVVDYDFDTGTLAGGLVLNGKRF